MSPVSSSTSVSNLFARCTGRAVDQLVADVCRAAAAEYWGQGQQVLRHYLADNFIRAAMQGMLVVKGANSSSSSITSSPRRVLPGAVGLLAMRAAHQQQQQQEQPQLEPVLLFNTGLYTEACQQLFVMFKDNTTTSTSRYVPLRQREHLGWLMCYLHPP